MRIRRGLRVGGFDSGWGGWVSVLGTGRRGDAEERGDVYIDGVSGTARRRELRTARSVKADLTLKAGGVGWGGGGICEFGAWRVSTGFWRWSLVDRRSDVCAVVRLGRNGWTSVGSSGKFLMKRQGARDQSCMVLDCCDNVVPSYNRSYLCLIYLCLLPNCRSWVGHFADYPG